MAISKTKKETYAALPNWMNPEKLRHIEEEFFGIKPKRDMKTKEELLDLIYVRESGRESAKEKGEA